MTPAVETPAKKQLPWTAIGWFAAVLLLTYAPVVRHLVRQWINDEDMGHGFFVPVIALFIVWQRREELLALKLKGNPWGLVLVLFSGCTLIVATLGAELFTARLSFLFTLIGVLWTLGGTLLLRKLAFPL